MQVQDMWRRLGIMDRLIKLVKNIEKMRLLEPYLRGRIRYLPPEAVIYSIQVPVSDIWALGCGALWLKC